MKSRLPSVSVVVPLFNKELYINRALQSVLAQTFTGYEVIVVDDGSTDAGPALVQAIQDPRVRLIRQANGGVSAARNRGIGEAKGELIAFLDADDEWLPTFLETVVDLRGKYPDAGLYATAYRTLSPAGEIIPSRSRPAVAGLKEALFHNYFRAAVYKAVDIHISAVAIPQAILKERGGFLPGQKLGEDLELFCRIGIRHSIAFSYTACGTYHLDVENSALQSNMVVNELPFVKSALEAIANGSVDSGLIRDLKEFIAEQQLWYARQHVLAANTHAAKTVLRQCDTNHFILRKLWWLFWARMPVGITSSAFRINKKCGGYLKRLSCS